MYRDKKISIYFPCRNEEKHLEQLINRIPKFIDEIIIISNKSTDNTYQKALNLGVKSIEDDRTIKGIGYGFAHMTGIKEATGDIILTADGDMTYPTERASEIIDYFLDNELDFISCNRYPKKDETKIPLILQFGVFILNFETRILYGKKINDILSGMWIFNQETKNKLHLTMGDWNLSPEIKIKAMTNKNINFSEFNIAQHQREGKTKQQYLATGLSHFFWIFKNRFFHKQPQ